MGTQHSEEVMDFRPDGVVVELGELGAGAVITEAGLARMMKRQIGRAHV